MRLAVRDVVQRVQEVGEHVAVYLRQEERLGAEPEAEGEEGAVVVGDP